MSDVGRGYDLTSVAQARGTINSLKNNPFEQQILATFAARLGAQSGLLCDLGCGPGQILVKVRATS